MKKLLCLICVLLCASVLCSCSVPSFSTQSMANPRNTLENFVQSMRERDFNAAMSYIGNYSSFAFENYSELEEGSSEKVIADYILDSYEITFPDDDRGNVYTGHSSEGLTVVGREATIEFTFRSFDLELMSTKLAEMVTEEGADRMFAGELFDSEEQVLTLAEEVFNENFSQIDDIEQYYVTREYTIVAVYQRGNWELQITDEFYNALVGN